MLLDEYDGQVPGTFEELEALPGVGHKTAACVISSCFKRPAFVVSDICASDFLMEICTHGLNKKIAALAKCIPMLCNALGSLKNSIFVTSALI